MGNNFEEENKNVINNNKNNKVLIIIIVVLLILLAAVGGFLASELLRSDKNENKENNNVENTENKNVENENITDNQNDNTITKEETEEFLNKYGDFLYVLDNSEKDNSMIFYYAISCLVNQNKYTKNNEIFIFNESDVKELVRILYMGHDFEYKSEGLNADYNPDNHSYNLEIHIGLANEELGPSKVKTKTIKDFKFENGIAEVTYNIKKTYQEIVKDETGKVITESNVDYQIKLIKVDNELRIKEISKNMYNN